MKEKLYNEALKACELSYSPYSNFAVGAAVLTKDGQIFKGANVENASYGATICAERAALLHAICNGNRDFSMIAIACNREGTIPYPCGMCLQVMMEFMPEGEVILMEHGELTTYKVTDLLPKQFIL